MPLKLPAPPPLERYETEFAPPERVDPLDRLRVVLAGFTEAEWCELARQLAPDRMVRLVNRAAVIAWLKTWAVR